MTDNEKREKGKLYAEDFPCFYCKKPATAFLGIRDPDYPQRPYCETCADLYKTYSMAVFMDDSGLEKLIKKEIEEKIEEGRKREKQ